MTRLLALAALIASFGYAPSSLAATIPADFCGENNALCSWDITVNGVQEMMGTYEVAADGTISFTGREDMVDLGGGLTAGITSMNGDADPIIGFAVAASTGAAGSTFIFNFNLPISLDGLVDAESLIGGALTATTAAGAEMDTFLLPTILVGTDVDTSIGGLPDLDKQVGALLGPVTQVGQGQILFQDSATSQIFVTPEYDTMTATIAFGLSENAQVGMSGFVEQVLAPEPGTVALLLIGVVGFVARRRLA